MNQPENTENQAVKQLLKEQSQELKTYIDQKHREMEELLAESEGRLSEQLRVNRSAHGVR